MCARTAAALLLSAAGGAGMPIESKQVTVGGFNCDSIQTARVHYPTDTSQKWPLLAFQHGWTEGGAATHTNYKDVIETVAAAGYFVIAEESCLSKLDYVDHKHDELRALAYVQQTQEFADRVDFSKVGIYGHSMGGAASSMNAADASAIAKYNLTAAVCLHPVVTGVPAPGGPRAKVLLPTLFFTGSSDTLVPPGSVRTIYDGAASPKIFAEIAGATHFACQSSENGIPSPHKETAATINWMNCHIKGSKKDCAAAFNVCDGTSPAGKMTECVSEGGGAPTPPAPTPPAPTPPAPAPAPAACIAELAKDCGDVQGKAAACARCVTTNVADIRAAGCKIVLGTRDDSYAWCHEKSS